MKIAYVCPFYEPAIGGVKQVVKELAYNMKKKGHEVHIFTSDWDKFKRIKVKEEIIDGIHVHRCFHILRIANFATVWPSVFFKLLKKDFDIIHSHLATHAHSILSAFVCKIKGIPHIHTTHCPWSDAYRSPIVLPFKWFSYNIFNKFVFKWAYKIIAITPWEIQFIKKYGGKNNVVVIHNGMSDIFYKKVKPNNFKKKLGIKGKLVLFFGRLSPTKAPDNLVLAGREILKERKDIHFVFIGPDEGLKKKVARMVKDEKNMMLLEPIRDRKKIAEMYQAADVYVLPSYREGLPLTLFEAMASGIPIVATPVNGVPYEMKDPKNGFLVPYGNIKALKEKILKILDNKKISKKMSKNNQDLSKNYRWNIIANKTEEVYKEAIKFYKK